MALLDSAPLATRTRIATRRTPDRADAPSVMALVDIAHPVEPQLQQAVGLAAAQGRALVVAVLHPRPGFSTDAAIVARQVRRLQSERAAVTGIVKRLLAGRQMPFYVQLMPYARRPLGNPELQARRTAERYLGGGPSRLVVAAPHLRSTDARS
jgi:hypothetical protein